jgi:MOSC domain-containing protein YiiM
MRLVSVNTGLPQELSWHGQSVRTAIVKSAVAGRVALHTLNLDGDRQADLSVHGGKNKAVYCYPLEHYDYWKTELPGREWPFGTFGENFTTDGLLETSVHIGDRFGVGSAEVIVTQPRLPCYKLAARFQSDAIIRQFLDSGRSGFYVAVAREGDVGAGDDVRLTSRDPNTVTVSDVMRLHSAKRYGPDEMALAGRALLVASLPRSWKDRFREGLEQPHLPMYP